VTAAVEPADVIEEFWVRDVVDLTWEALRLRRLKAELLRSSTAKGLQKVLEPLVRLGSYDLANAWYARDYNARQRVQELLEQAGQSTDAITAQTLAVKLDDVERIDRMLASAEVRRNAVLREIDRHRSAVAERLRTAAEQIEDADFSEVSVTALARAAE
jgi:hypothetical protein